MKLGNLRYRLMKAERLFELGHEALGEDDFEKARTIGQILVEKRYSGGFEILGRAALGEGNRDEARRWFQEGVKVAPGVWQLWHELGIVESDGGDFDAAQAALDRALGLPHADRTLVTLGLAELQARRGDWDGALRALDRAEELDSDAAPYRSQVLANRISVLRRASRHAEVLEFFRAVQGELDEEALLRAHDDYLMSRYALGEERQALRAEILRLDRGLRCGTAALWVLRDMQGPRAGLVAYQLVVEVQAAVDGERRPAFVAAQVTAASPEEALEMVREFEGDPSARLESCRVDALSHPSHPGIYNITAGYIFWQRDGEA